MGRPHDAAAYANRDPADRGFSRTWKNAYNVNIKPKKNLKQQIWMLFGKQ